MATLLTLCNSPGLGWGIPASSGFLSVYEKRTTVAISLTSNIANNEQINTAMSPYKKQCL